MNTKQPQSFYAERTMRENVKGIMETYHATGKIGSITPRSEAHAKDVARGISKSTRRRSK